MDAGLMYVGNNCEAPPPSRANPIQSIPMRMGLCEEEQQPQVTEMQRRLKRHCFLCISRSRHAAEVRSSEGWTPWTLPAPCRYTAS